MKNGIIILCVALMGLAPQLSMAGNLDKDFDQALVKYCKISAEEVAGIRASGVAAEEIPVVCHISRKTGASLESVAQGRVRGHSWAQIAKGKNGGACPS